MILNYELACIDCRVSVRVGHGHVNDPAHVELAAGSVARKDIAQFLVEHRRHHLEFGDSFYIAAGEDVD